jgi:membrane protein YdbS with pleckstrin-like domain
LIEEPVWRRIMHHYIVAEKEIIYKSGLIRKQRMTMPYQSVADVKIEKGVMGRIFNFGDVVLEGFKNNLTINGIRRPEELYEQLRAKIRPKTSATVYKKE